MSLQISASSTAEVRMLASDARPVQEIPPVPAPKLELPQAQTVQTPPSAKAVQAAAAQIESYLQKYDRQVNFAVDTETGKTVVTVLNRSTGEVVRQIPNAETLRIAQQLESGNSALVDLMA